MIEEVIEEDGNDLRIPLTKKPGFAKLNAFLTGLNLDYFYRDASNCLYTVFFTGDDLSYFMNNVTYFRQANESFMNPYLNLTGIIGGNFATAIPKCYNFGKAVVETERERLDYFNSSTGVFIAFTWYQVNHAMEFYAIYNNIQWMKFEQNQLFR